MSNDWKKLRGEITDVKSEIGFWFKCVICAKKGIPMDQGRSFYESKCKELHKRLKALKKQKKQQDSKLRNFKVADRFSTWLVNRNKHQGDGTNTAEDFVDLLCSLGVGEVEWWMSRNTELVLDFEGVDTISPGFFNELVWSFSQVGKEDFLKKFKFINLSPVKKEILELEIERVFKEEQEHRDRTFNLGMLKGRFRR